MEKESVFKFDGEHITSETDVPEVLIVDDNPQNIFTLETILRKNNYYTISSDCCKKTLEILAKFTPDIILMDIMMPETDGFTCCKKIKSIVHLKDIPIIFITGKEDVRDITRAFQLGAVDYIKKPFHKDELLVRVATHVNLKRYRDQQAELIQKLEKTLQDVKTLQGLIPICSHCKKIRNDDGYWNNLEHYFQSHSDVSFSHGICPDCLKKEHPETYERLKKEGRI